MGAAVLTRRGWAAGKFRLALTGLVHGHARGFLRQLTARADVELVGVAEEDTSLHDLYGKAFSLKPEIFFRDRDAMIEKTRPDAVAAFTSTFDHAAVVETCAKRKLPVMMEKPLAVNRIHATRIAEAARAASIPVVVNYETTWYRSHAALKREVDSGALGAIRKMVAMDGHQGPKEIGVGPEFFRWLTDPRLNGAGALFDFGCYGANLMTWLLGNRRPLAVTALVATNKPAIYRAVDDEASVLVQYEGAQGIIQASWNWPVNRKDLEVYGERGYAHATGGNLLRVRRPGAKDDITPELPELPAEERDPVSYLMAVAQGRLKADGLSSLENNLIATEILCAARESVRMGRTRELRRG